MPEKKVSKSKKSSSKKSSSKKVVQKDILSQPSAQSATISAPVHHAVAPASQAGSPAPAPAYTSPVRTVSHITRLHIIGTVVLILVVAAAGGTSYYFYQEYRKAQLQLANPVKAAQLEVEDVVAKVGKLIQLPGGESPSLATVSDIEQLKGQTFFRNAKNGDKLLIYSKAKKAYLYRPYDNILVEVSPLEIAEKIGDTSSGQTAAVQGVSTQQAPARTVTIAPATVTVYNGTSVNGLGGMVEEDIKKNIDTARVIDVAMAEKQNYTKTLVIDISGKRPDMVKQLARLLQAEVTNLPNYESKPNNTDILVIAGSDKVARKPSPTPVSKSEEGSSDEPGEPETTETPEPTNPAE